MTARRGQGDYHHDQPPPEPLDLFNPEQGDAGERMPAMEHQWQIEDQVEHLQRLREHDQAVQNHYENMNALADIYEDIVYLSFLQRAEEEARPDHPQQVMQQPAPEGAAADQPVLAHAQEEPQGDDRDAASGPHDL